MEPKTLPNLKVAEVEFIYRTNVPSKDRAKIKSSQDDYGFNNVFSTFG